MLFWFLFVVQFRSENKIHGTIHRQIPGCQGLQFAVCSFLHIMHYYLFCSFVFIYTLFSLSIFLHCLFVCYLYTLLYFHFLISYIISYITVFIKNSLNLPCSYFQIIQHFCLTSSLHKHSIKLPLSTLSTAPLISQTAACNQTVTFHSFVVHHLLYSPLLPLCFVLFQRIERPYSATYFIS